MPDTEGGVFHQLFSPSRLRWGSWHQRVTLQPKNTFPFHAIQHSFGPLKKRTSAFLRQGERTTCDRAFELCCLSAARRSSSTNRKPQTGLANSPASFLHSRMRSYNKRAASTPLTVLETCHEKWTNFQSLLQPPRYCCRLYIPLAAFSRRTRLSRESSNS